MARSDERKERLASALRENLRRRKQRAREMPRNGTDRDQQPVSAGGDGKADRPNPAPKTPLE